MTQRCRYVVGLAALVHRTYSIDNDYDNFQTKSHIGVWVDVDTPMSARQVRTSRGETWDLVMSDEFQLDGRSFRPGDDHLWTALDIPDGVNAALEIYNSSNVYTKNGKLINKAEEGPTVVTYFNQWLEEPGFETRTMHYKAGMMQSWNKFCMQGGFIEVSAKLPGAVNNIPDAEHKSVTMNPNAVGEYTDPATKVKRVVTPQDRIIDGGYYPTWPGIWLLGNLGRALFAASTTRMWPWSYDACDPDLLDLAPHQVISACNATPGFGLNPNQGRGAPEIDILEGGGAAISSSIQLAPGMPDNYRRIPVGLPDEEPWGLNKYCVYGKGCKTPGANIADIPTSAFASRGHKSWYQGLKYAANNRCRPLDEEKQNYDQVYNFVKIGNLYKNVFDKEQMSASRDAHADLGLIDGKGPGHWGINSNGTCFPVSNGYIGAYLCDPDAKNPKCEAPRRDGVADTNQMPKFEYQMDAISANWDIGHEAYTTFYKYQVEWVVGNKTTNDGYIRWSLDGSPLFEIPATVLTSPPQRPEGSTASKNPVKVMIEEPMYIIFNVALAKAWGTTPPNIDVGPCRGNATHPPHNSWDYNKSNNICDSFPMYMEIDYIRVYQDTRSMHVGCDPPSHPTKEWIDGHIEWYTNANNPMIRVAGRASCHSDDDCTTDNIVVPPTGRCHNRRCECVQGFGGPRCTKFINIDTEASYGPSSVYPILLLVLSGAAVTYSQIRRRRWLHRVTTIAEANAGGATALSPPPTTSKPRRSGGDGDEDDDDVMASPVVAGIRRYYGPAHQSATGGQASTMA
ncbi:hypothetical protein H257_10441 [Aphanomyces astaci]|uniref:EGF-like domain-containing protein n=2 Tax=Aphanomyces astaci TaxID=112090 RepID=W4G880_APHAT|nr:hypothetical protein H257_10441 [Aphanomyces astaci]ETV75249.1 hypothetical protein H257_10441 [Aphanomyces astaci]|eukprot:XP_009835297.1 hypothetical protein H257_10441 [Aphanomyces astaci]